MSFENLQFTLTKFKTLAGLGSDIEQAIDASYENETSRKISKLWRDFACALSSIPYCDATMNVDTRSSGSRYFTTGSGYWVYNRELRSFHEHAVYLQSALFSEAGEELYTRAHDSMEWMQSTEEALAKIREHLAESKHPDFARRLETLMTELLVDIDAASSDPIGIFIRRDHRQLRLSLDIAEAPNHIATIEIN